MVKRLLGDDPFQDELRPKAVEEEATTDQPKEDGLPEAATEERSAEAAETAREERVESAALRVGKSIARRARRAEGPTRQPRASVRPAQRRHVPSSPARARPAPRQRKEKTAPSTTGSSLTTLEIRFEEALREIQSRLQTEAGLEAGTRRRLEEELRLFGDRMARRLEMLRPKDARDRHLLDSARELLTPDVILRLATRLWLRGRSLVVDAFGYDPVEARILEPLVATLVEKWFRAEVQGVEAIPDEGPALVVANHAGVIPFDGLVLSYTVRRNHPRRRDVRWLAENEVHHFPFFGALMSRLGAVRACPENAQALLDRGQVVAVFPEGNTALRKTYSERYRLRRFGRGGAIKLALRTGVPIVPAAIVGGEETYPLLWRTNLFARWLGIPFLPVTPFFPFLGPLGLVPLPVRWRLMFGSPIHLDLPPSAADDTAVVSRINEQVRGVVQGLLTELLRQRRGVWW